MTSIRFPLARWGLMVALPLAVTACATSVASPEPASVAPAQWYAPPLPHQGQAAEMGQWWGRFNDPLLLSLIESAQAASPTIASARARVMDARVALAGTRDAQLPQVAATASVARGITDVDVPLGTTASAGLQASWVIDLFGAQAAGTRQAIAQESQAVAGWHEARVVMAAQTAQAYFGYRGCVEQLAVVAADRDSRASTAKSNAITEEAGLTAPAVAALARASAAEGVNRFEQQRTQCERQVKALVAVTGLAEPDLRQSLAKVPTLPAAGSLQGLLTVGSVPATVVRQRPDVYQAAAELVAAGEGVNVSRAALWPSVSLSASAFRTHFEGGGIKASLNSWQFGPLALNIPLLGRSALNANVDASVSRYESASTGYAAAVRQAVSEVEQALVNLDSMKVRVEENQKAFEGYDRSFAGTQARYGVGLAGLTELEDARRLRLAAASAVVAMRLEQINAWIELYVALGGGFDPDRANDALRPS